MNKNQSDKQLIVDYLNGNQTSLEILIKKYLGPIYKFVYRYVRNIPDAEDITQEVFIKMWQNLKKFDLNKNFKAWFFTVAKNTCLDSYKKKRFVSLSFLERNNDNNLFDLSINPNKLISRLDAQQKIMPAIEKLSPQYRLVLHLYYHNQFNFREISEKLNESINTIKSRYRRALAILKNQVDRF